MRLSRTAIVVSTNVASFFYMTQQVVAATRKQKSAEGRMPVSGSPAPALHLREPGLLLPKAPTRLRACLETFGTGSMLFLNSLFLYGIILTMSIPNAFAEQPVSYQTIRVDDLDIFYREAGPKNAPAILCLHGLPSSSRMYQPLLESSLSSKYHLIAPDYPGFGHSSWPDHRDFNYSFDHLAKVMQDFADQMRLDRYTLFMQDYGGPVGFRMALVHPEKVQAMIIQNAVAHEEGLSPLWSVRRAFWEDRSAHEAEVRTNLLSLEATRKRHVGTSPDPGLYNPDLWVDEYYFLNQPGQAEIQLDLFYDYQNNVRSYPSWQKWLRDNQPPLLVLWGRYDTSFTVAGAEGYRKDDSAAQVHILDAGHFAMDLQAQEIIRLTEAFMNEQRFK